jgi:hypothetical protein
MTFKEAAEILGVEEDFVRSKLADLGIASYCYRAFDGGRDSDYMLNREEVQKRFSAWKNLFELRNVSDTII